MSDQLERVAKTLWDVSEEAISRQQGMHKYKPVPWEHAASFRRGYLNNAARVLEALRPELEETK